jgi:hypothetical protein
MFQGEFDGRIAKGEPVDVALNATEPDDENPTISAGYTYLGQFIDHDITFDPVSSLDRFNDPDALQDFRTPRLDLDSLYGTGPDDQPFLYQADGMHLLLGDDKDFDAARKKRPDLPRNNGIPRRALIGDKRNDENLIVSQLHCTFLRFHNAVMDRVLAERKPKKPEEFAAAFAEAQRLVRWHYQWVVLHDFIRTVVGDKTYKAVIGGPGEVPKVQYFEVKGRYAFIPIEFSVAAYRFGHTMVRPSYALNRKATVADPKEQPFNGKTAKFNRIPIFSLVDVSQHEFANLNGFRELPPARAVDWSFFFKGVKPDGAPPPKAVLPQPSYKLDTVLVDPLTALPDHQDQPPPRNALAVLNLLRGYALGLPSGQAVAHRMGFEPLTDQQIYTHGDTARNEARQDLLTNNPLFEGNTPLWFYILREAEVLEKSQHLGPVGGTIVAEVLAGLMMEDRHSFLSQWPRWKPMLPAKTAGSFTMADLINFTNQSA